MSKKLISLVLVLALTGMASALQWAGPGNGTVAPWETISNWAGGTRLPVASDTTTPIYRSDGTGSNVTISTAVAGGIKPQMKSGITKLEILTGGSMSADGSFEQTLGTSSLVIVDTGALLDVARKVTQATGTYKMASTGTSQDTLDIYGTVRVKGQGTNGTSDILVAGAATSGNAYVYIRSGGVLNVDAYTINARGIVKLYGIGAGSGVMWIKGNKTAQVATDAGAGKIVCPDGTLTWAYVASADVTRVWNVPEPATVALLGLGSLLLYRKKH